MSLDNLVFVKSNRHGLVIHLEKTASFDELLAAIRQKFQNTARFFEETKLAVSFEGRALSMTEEMELVNVIEEFADVRIVCIMDKDTKREKRYKRLVEESLSDIDRQDGQFYRGNLKRRQTLESERSVIILGDVEAGATVAAAGNVIVLGAAKGKLYAGAGGDQHAFIMALQLMPEELGIGDIKAKRHVSHQEEDRMIPKIAVVDGAYIYMDPLSE